MDVIMPKVQYVDLGAPTDEGMWATEEVPTVHVWYLTVS